MNGHRKGEFTMTNGQEPTSTTLLTAIDRATIAHSKLRMLAYGLDVMDTTGIEVPEAVTGMSHVVSECAHDLETLIEAAQVKARSDAAKEN